MSDNFSTSQRVIKPVVRSGRGVVASQHIGAARIGAKVLADGGNAIDAAVATSFALGVIEPWMSGIGGGGLMVVRHPDGRAHAVDFGMRAPHALDPDAYPLAEGMANGLFAWPAVEEDRNMIGPLSIAVPGVVDGIGKSHAAWGTKPWADLVAPAVELARHGLAVDWYATLVIGQASRGLARWPASSERFLADGFPPPAPMAPAAESRLPAPKLAATLETLMREGHRALYEGPLAERIARDAGQLGCPISASDLASYEAAILAPLEIGYRGARIWATPELSAGPTLADVLRRHAEFEPGNEPDADWYLSLAGALNAAYERRLAEMGDIDGGRTTGCTTHFSAVDADGMMVSVTQTLLSVFGSMVTFPESGILMNNGIFWFDPRPGRPNSLAPGKRCLSNMCPIVAERADGVRLALGASGGRRILPAVAQVTGFLTDFCMDLEEALHHPRIDVSGTDLVLADTGLAGHIIERLTSRYTCQKMKRTVYPSWFANVSAVAGDRETFLGGSEPTLPWSDAVGA